MLGKYQLSPSLAPSLLFLDSFLVRVDTFGPGKPHRLTARIRKKWVSGMTGSVTGLWGRRDSTGPWSKVVTAGPSS